MNLMNALFLLDVDISDDYHFFDALTSSPRCGEKCRGLWGFHWYWCRLRWSFTCTSDLIKWCGRRWFEQIRGEELHLEVFNFAFQQGDVQRNWGGLPVNPPTTDWCFFSCFFRSRFVYVDGHGTVVDLGSGVFCRVWVVSVAQISKPRFPTILWNFDLLQRAFLWMTKWRWLSCTLAKMYVVSRRFLASRLMWSWWQTTDLSYMLMKLEPCFLPWFGKTHSFFLTFFSVIRGETWIPCTACICSTGIYWVSLVGLIWINIENIYCIIIHVYSIHIYICTHQRHR